MTSCGHQRSASGWGDPMASSPRAATSPERAPSGPRTPPCSCGTSSGGPCGDSWRRRAGERRGRPSSASSARAPVRRRPPCRRGCRRPRPSGPPRPEAPRRRDRGGCAGGGCRPSRGRPRSTGSKGRSRARRPPCRPRTGAPLDSGRGVVRARAGQPFDVREEVVADGPVHRQPRATSIAPKTVPRRNASPIATSETGTSAGIRTKSRCRRARLHGREEAPGPLDGRGGASWTSPTRREASGQTCAPPLTGPALRGRCAAGPRRGPARPRAPRPRSRGPSRASRRRWKARSLPSASSRRTCGVPV